MIKLFKPEDFHVWVNDHPHYKSGDPLLLDARIAKAANQILQREVENSKELYSFANAKFHSNNWGPMESFPNKNPTHKGILMFIEEIKKECTKHEPDSIYDGKGKLIRHECKHCGVKLVAEWKEA